MYRRMAAAIEIYVYKHFFCHSIFFLQNKECYEEEEEEEEGIGIFAISESLLPSIFYLSSHSILCSAYYPW